MVDYQYMKERVDKMEDRVNKMESTSIEIKEAIISLKSLPDLIQRITDKQTELSERMMKVEIETQANTNTRVDFKQLLFGVVTGILVAYFSSKLW